MVPGCTGWDESESTTQQGPEVSLSIPGSEYTSLLPARAGHSTQGQAVLSSPSRSSSVEASPPKVVRCVDIKACRQHVLVAQRGDDTVQLTCRAEGKESGHSGSHPSAPMGRGQPSHSPEESSLRQQSENPKRTAKCRGNMSWIPRLQGEGMGSVWAVHASSSPRRQREGRVLPYLAVSAPFVIKVLISSSWPYLAATWRGVLPYLSAQSISLPGKGKPSVTSGSLHSSPRKPLKEAQTVLGVLNKRPRLFRWLRLISGMWLITRVHSVSCRRTATCCPCWEPTCQPGALHLPLSPRKGCVQPPSLWLNPWGAAKPAAFPQEYCLSGWSQQQAFGLSCSDLAGISMPCSALTALRSLCAPPLPQSAWGSSPHETAVNLSHHWKVLRPSEQTHRETLEEALSSTAEGWGNPDSSSHSPF